VRLFETYGESTKQLSSIRGGLGASRQRIIAEFIEEHLGEDIGLVALAAEAGLSPNHFGKVFKATFGKPPCRYINELRIRKAKEMLLADHASITEIALALGFSSHSHFTDMFRKLTGTTPSRFRGNRG
jgi:AraC family transcriptional regulator